MRVEANGIVFSVNLTRKYAIVASINDKQNQHLCIPEIVNGYPVVAIEAFAFKDNPYLRIVEIPNSVSKIKSCAFANCSGLREILFYNSDKPSKELSVEDQAFWECKSLTNFSADEDIYIICGTEAFKNCSNLKNIQGLLFVLKNRVFENCCSLDGLTFAENTWWKSDTFKGCSKLKNLTFCGDVEELLSDSCIKWLRSKKIKAKSMNSIFADLVYSGTNITFI